MIRNAIFGLSILSILSQRNNLKRWALFLISTSILSFGYLFSSSIDLILIMMLIFSISSIDFKSFNLMIKAGIFGVLIGISLVFLFCGLRLIPDNIQIRLGVVRRSFGFNAPILFPGLMYAISSSILLLKRNSITWRLILLTALLNGVPMLVSNGRSYFVMYIISLVLIIFINKDNRLISRRAKCWIMFFITFLSVSFGAFFSVYLTTNYDYKNILVRTINNYLTGRLMWWNMYWETYELRPFGQDFLSGEAASNFGLNSNMVLDNLYLQLLLRHGYIISIMVGFIFFMMLYRLVKNNDLVSIILWFSWTISFFVGATAMYLNRNFMILQLVILLSQKPLYQKEDESSTKIMETESFLDNGGFGHEQTKK